MIFSDERRKLLAKTVMDLAKIQGAAALTSAFFKSMPLSGRVAMAVVFFGLLVLGFLLEPEGKSEGK